LQPLSKAARCNRPPRSPPLGGECDREPARRRPRRPVRAGFGGSGGTTINNFYDAPPDTGAVDAALPDAGLDSGGFQDASDTDPGLDSGGFDDGGSGGGGFEI
jgi:hypothetical protein